MPYVRNFLIMTHNQLNNYTKLRVQQLLVPIFISLSIIVSLWLRYTSIAPYGLGHDDIDHLRLSSGENLWQVITGSYKDAHPPLRNIILYHLKKLLPADFTTYRLVSLIPSIFIPCLFCILIFYSAGSYLSAITGCLVLVFSLSFITKGHDTRPYSLTIFILIFHILFFFKYYRTNQSFINLSCIFATGMLLVLADYGVIAVLIAFMTVGLCGFLYRRKYKAAFILAITYLFILFFFLLRYFLSTLYQIIGHLKLNILANT